MASGYQPEDEGVFEINVTPMVDVVLVLLVIFMVTAPAIAKRGIAFQEPETVSGTRLPASLEITIDKDRVIHIDGEPTADLDEAKRTIAELHGAKPDIKALITADVRVPHGEVMALLDVVKQAGVRKFAFASKRKRE